MRVLGVPQSLMARIYTVEFLLVGCWPAQWAWFWGGSAIQVFVALLANLVSVALPGPMATVCRGHGRGHIVDAGFGLPSVLVAQVPPLRVIRRDLGGLKPLSVLAWLSGLVSLTGCCFWSRVTGSLAASPWAGLLALCWCLPC